MRYMRKSSTEVAIVDTERPATDFPDLSIAIDALRGVVIYSHKESHTMTTVEAREFLDAAAALLATGGAE